MTVPAIKLTKVDGGVAFKPSGFLGGALFGAYREATEGAKYNGSANVAPLDKVSGILLRLREAGFPVDVPQEVTSDLERFTASQWVDLHGARERTEAIDAEFRKSGRSLFPFQRTGVTWLSTRYGALLADEMGLGKTVQTLASLPAGAPIVIVCPAVAKGVWQREIATWRPHLAVEVLEGRGSFRWPARGEVVILNYDILPPGHRAVCKDKACDGCALYLADAPEGVVVVADEAHALKTSKALRTKAFRILGERVRARGGRTWLLTATPLTNQPPDLWSVLQCAGIAQEAFGSYKGFSKAFGAVAGRFGTEWGSPDTSVGERMKRVMLRRLRAEVLPDLPTKSWRHYPVPVDAKTLRLAEKALAEVGGVDKLVEAIVAGREMKLEVISRARAALAAAKLPAAKALVEEYEEQGEPVVVFSAYRATVDVLGAREGWRAITGDTSAAERTEIADLFQAGKLKGVAGTIPAMGVALTLTRAAHALFVDQDWTPALNAQAEDRICRIGQTRGCLITILVASHPLDERLAEVLSVKQSVVRSSVDAARDVTDRPEDEAEERLKLLEGAIMDVGPLPPEPEPEPRREAPPPPPSSRPSRRGPVTPAERWTKHALRMLAACDGDRASVQNGVGFNKFDGVFGHSLAQQVEGGLSDRQWSAAVALCRKYQGQVGTVWTEADVQAEAEDHAQESF